MVERAGHSSGRRLLLVGLGTVSEVHRRALELLPEVEVAAGVDIRGGSTLRFRGAALPVYRDLEEALTLSRCDIVVVSVPTPRHTEVCAALIEAWPRGLILVEKPMALNLGEIRALQRAALARGKKLRVLYHAAYGDEVRWACRQLSRLVAEHGPVRTIDAYHGDPYLSADPGRAAALVSSWVDSGINGLSILHRLVRLDPNAVLRTLEAHFSTFEASVGFQSDGVRGRATLFTTWHVTQATKLTRLCFEDGSELALDHTAVCARVTRHGRVVEMQGSDGAVPRLVAHYLNLFRARFQQGLEEWSDEDDLHLHSLLLQPST